MSESEEDLDEGSNVGTNETNQLLFIAKEVLQKPNVLEKSQKPAAKNAKAECIQKITEKYEKMFGKKITSPDLLKKINNMKTRLKEKTDKKKTGNKKIVLKEWQKILLQAMAGDSNPTIAQLPGKLKHIFSNLLSLTYIYLVLFLYTKILLHKNS